MMGAIQREKGFEDRAPAHGKTHRKGNATPAQTLMDPVFAAYCMPSGFNDIASRDDDAYGSNPAARYAFTVSSNTPTSPRPRATSCAPSRAAKIANACRLVAARSALPWQSRG